MALSLRLRSPARAGASSGLSELSPSRRSLLSIGLVLIACNACKDPPDEGFDAAALRESVRLALTETDPASKTRALEDLRDDLEAQTARHPEARLLLVECLGLLAQTVSTTDTAAAARIAADRITRARELLAAHPDDGAIRAFLASHLGLNGKVDEGWKILMGGLPVTSPDRRSQLALLNGAHVIIAYLRAHGREARKEPLGDDYLSLVRKAREHADASGDRAYRIAVREIEGELLASMNHLPEAWTRLHELEGLGADSLASVKLRLTLEGLGPEPTPDR